MRRRMLFAVVAFATAALAKCEMVPLWPITKHPIEMTLYAIDEWGNPLAGESVSIFPFLEDKPFAKWGKTTGKTDSTGYFKIKGTPGKLTGSECHCYFREKDDYYYETIVPAGGCSIDAIDVESVITGVVRKVGNPISLHSFGMELSEKRNVAYGFDVLKGELMPPEGHGSVTDAVVRISTEERAVSSNESSKSFIADISFEMVNDESGFACVPCFPSCVYEEVREAPSDISYRRTFSTHVVLGESSYSVTNILGAVRGQSQGVLKVARKSKNDSSRCVMYYGILSCLDFRFGVWHGVRTWEFRFSGWMNGRPDDRNLERMPLLSYPPDAWCVENRHRLSQLPVPKALRKSN